MAWLLFTRAYHMPIKFPNFYYIISASGHCFLLQHCFLRFAFIVISTASGHSSGADRAPFPSWWNCWLVSSLRLSSLCLCLTLSLKIKYKAVWLVHSLEDLWDFCWWKESLEKVLAIWAKISNTSPSPFWSAWPVLSFCSLTDLASYPVFLTFRTLRKSNWLSEARMLLMRFWTGIILELPQHAIICTSPSPQNVPRKLSVNFTKEPSKKEKIIPDFVETACLSPTHFHTPRWTEAIPSLFPTFRSFRNCSASRNLWNRAKRSFPTHHRYSSQFPAMTSSALTVMRSTLKNISSCWLLYRPTC